MVGKATFLVVGDCFLDGRCAFEVSIESDDDCHAVIHSYIA